MSTSSRHKITSNLAHVRPRNNPTNTHTRIFLFSQTQVPPHMTKCTPTFHSNVFNSANYQNEGNQRNQCNLNKTVTYSNATKNVRQASLRHGVNKTITLGKGIEEFEDRDKETLLKKLQLSNTYDRIRKNAELSSTPIIDLADKQIFPAHFAQDIALPNY